MNLKVLAISSIALAALISVGCGGSSSSDGDVVEVKLMNWSIEPEVSTVDAGNVTFRAIHEAEGHAHGAASEGGNIHELAVARKNADGGSEIVGTAADIAPGKQKDLTLNLAAGDYELQCNVVEMVGGKPVAHYPLGMHTPFTVS